MGLLEPSWGLSEPSLGLLRTELRPLRTELGPLRTKLEPPRTGLDPLRTKLELFRTKMGPLRTELRHTEAVPFTTDTFGGGDKADRQPSDVSPFIFYTTFYSFSAICPFKKKIGD